ncbi:MAG: zincin-like metallopeptidase domain-containing protein [Rhodospirillales bacterium]
MERKQSLYDKVTDSIIRELETGVAPWVKPWRAGAEDVSLPCNGATSREYSGINIPVLWSEALRKGYHLPRWLTFRQAKELGGHVRKGEQGTTVVFVKHLTRREGETNEDDDTSARGSWRRSVLRSFTVFNVAQCDGLPERLREPLASRPEGERHQAAERFLVAIGADVRHGGNRAFYSPSHDVVSLPPFTAFESAGHYYATSFHEHVHWSGSERRLAREFGKRFGDRAYAAEELVAELGAAFLCAHLRLEGRLRHAEYIGSWLDLLKDDNRAVFTAASKASQAADFLRSFSTPRAASEHHSP